MQQTLYTIAIWAVPVLFAITLHEAAHGWVASKLGDPTARQLGRITMNPIKHVDLVGTVIIPLVLALSRTGFIFGWAKPVPVDPRHFKQPLLDMALVALAGPVSNFVMACGWALVITSSKGMLADSSMAIHLMRAGQAGMLINIVLMVLNLVPIPPLDGGRVVAGVLPKDIALAYMRIEPFGMWIIIALLFSGLLGKILWPVVQQFEAIISAIFIF